MTLKGSLLIIAAIIVFTAVTLAVSLWYRMPASLAH